MKKESIIITVLAILVIVLTIKICFFTSESPATEMVTTEQVMVPDSLKTWKKIEDIRHDLGENPFTLFGNSAALSVGNKEKMNVMTIGWGGLGVLWRADRPVVTVYVEQRRYTRTFMEENEYFTITAFPEEYNKYLKYFGTVSGRDEDKVKNSSLEVKWMENDAPAFEDGRVILVCKKIYGAPFNPEGFGELGKEMYSKRPLHTIYIGEIVAAYVKE